VSAKLAATFNSTGVPSCFLDSTQALHGDLGLCEGERSGHPTKQQRPVRGDPPVGAPSKANRAQDRGPDGKSRFRPGPEADFRLLYRVRREACPLELAPTASTTAAMALGDALAMVLLEARGLTRDDFARYHPAGNLGRVLLLRVSDIMRKGSRLPIAADSVSVQEAILAMTRAKSGSIALVNRRTGKLTGILTDGDFRRSALSGPHFLSQPVSDFMTRSPKRSTRTPSGRRPAVVRAHKIDDLIVVDGRHRPVGLIDGQDLAQVEDRVKRPSESASSGWAACRIHHAAVRSSRNGPCEASLHLRPEPEAFASRQEAWRFSQRDPVHPDYRAMLEAHHSQLDLVVAPTPIHLIGRCTRAITAFGLPAYLEKPPTRLSRTGRMIAADSKAQQGIPVGFNLSSRRAARPSRKGIPLGEFGAVGEHPDRPLAQADRVFREDILGGSAAVDAVWSSIGGFGNAMAPFCHNMLFWTGSKICSPGLKSPAVRAELLPGHASRGGPFLR